MASQAEANEAAVVAEQHTFGAERVGRNDDDVFINKKIKTGAGVKGVWMRLAIRSHHFQFGLSKIAGSHTCNGYVPF